MTGKAPWVVDYDRDIDYREYWETRDYENWSEQLALRRLLAPEDAGWLADFGAGYGRLYPVYHRLCKRAILVDYSLKQLREARATVGRGVPLVAANLYALPFRADSIPSAVMFRVLHHLVAYERAFAEISRVVSRDLVVEIPNKRHALSRLRGIVRRTGSLSDWPPANLARDAQETFLNYHPAAVLHRLGQHGWQVVQSLSASNLRAPCVKRALPAPILRRLEYRLQFAWAPSMLGPSLVARLNRAREPVEPPQSARDLLCCPGCSMILEDGAGQLTCTGCGATFPILGDQFWDLRWPRATVI